MINSTIKLIKEVIAYSKHTGRSTLNIICDALEMYLDKKMGE